MAALHNKVGPIKRGQVRVFEYANTELVCGGIYVIPVMQGVVVHSEIVG